MDKHTPSDLDPAVGARCRARRAIYLGILICVLLGVPTSSALDELRCENGAILAGGDPDRAIFASEASRGVRASWCERYDRYGKATRTGPYREIYPTGALRTEARYVRSRLQGRVTVRNEDGGLFLRGFLVGGEWVGEFELFHPNGALWLETHFDHGVLEGATRTHYADGALESETRFQNGREDGLARSFYPSSLGGRLKSEVFVEADRMVGQHRILDRRGAIIQSIDWDTGPIAWRTTQPAPASSDSSSAPARARATPAPARSKLPD